MSLAARILLALVLMVGFYLLALGIAGGLLWIPYAEWVYAHRLHPKIALACVIGAGIILWSILPRFDRFDPPWPPLRPGEHPRLFALIREVAAATGQAMPVEVYLDPDLNAWVAQRGGLMGIGSRRVMGIGLPLLVALTTSQLRAVLAHEFGHYHGGDTKLGPWIYKTRGAIIRTVQALAGSGGILYRPFLWYGKLFLRITHAVSRGQEVAADALAARVAGRDSATAALRTVHGSALAFGAYLNSELEPVLGAGYRPPVAEGFARFLHASSIAEAVGRAVAEEEKAAAKDPYDTHPPLRERLAALEHAPGGPAAPADDPPAVTLLERVPEMELRLLEALTGKEKAARLKPVTWDAVGGQVFLPSWETQARRHAAALKGMSPVTLPTQALDLAALGRRLYKDAENREEAEAAGRLALGAAFAVALRRAGWELETDVGAAVTFRRGGDTIEPFGVVGELAGGKLDPVAWKARCEALGIAGLDFGDVGPPPSAPAPGTA
jgi:Zn-dependent protease with chaperone function